MWVSAWIPADVDFVAHFPSNRRFFRRARNRRILSIFLCGNATSKLSATNGDLRVRFRQKHPYKGKLWCPYYLRALHRLLRTLLPSIFMTGVHPPSPHPKFPMWQRTDVGFESKIIVIIWVVLVLDKERKFLDNNCSGTCIRRTPCIKRTLRLFPRVSKTWRFHCLQIKNSVV